MSQDPFLRLQGMGLARETIETRDLRVHHIEKICTCCTLDGEIQI